MSLYGILRFLIKIGSVFHYTKTENIMCLRANRVRRTELKDHKLRTIFCINSMRNETNLYLLQSGLNLVGFMNQDI